ncbi:MAG: nucleotidyltransferase domain-containing protein [Acaryochloridaceae cyanobacterium RU_4_10]|nr:nucleotidyltransferase domain-containing protein [Acaryochloridaceae cyanobacterium RU_4_10]
MNELEMLKAASTRLTQDYPNLKLLILFGSRARGEEDPSSDWDFAFLSEHDRPPQSQLYWFPASNLLNALCKILQVSDETIDLVDLSTCSDILAHFVARDGQAIYEKMSGEFAQFQKQALKTNAQLKQYRHAQREKVLETLKRWAL